ncbi:MAG: Gfo/Idh/MocA family oxidoreductase [Paludisphaera borealis]|uniref:Gfo/Idh/MocA family protein n=1 Tax=Paludisphaera borealis TaxID=1387353 RepID=UPI00283FF69E|nr:Gfo/Idh/MocA family oxidoreductase [Paludisphaera borealis]MDR3619781.1 Gfo/Idh/MocA family oxidoreductase [Paludisphaera borealis]
MKRRDFLTTSAVAGVSGSFLRGAAPAVARAAEESPNSKVRFACIGVGGKGDSDTNDAGKHGEIIALCDVDEKTLDKMAAKYPNAKKYFDYRKMLEEIGDKIDAVTVSTPDHSHAVASAMAMRMGKHTFCQKPLTWSIEEARVLRTLAAEKNLCTQMGNQGTADDGFREGVELLKAGSLGPIKEIHVWTNRPIWPQGVKRPTDTPGIPNNVHWYEFLGPAHDRPYHGGYHPFNWRGWLDFGTGALGDMACHTINVAAMGLELFDAESVEVLDTSGIVDRETYPTWSIIKTQFGERNGRAPLSLTWYDGGDKLPEEKRAYKKLLHGEKSSGSGLLIVGEKGSFYSVNDYGAEHVLLPRDKYKEFKKPEATLPRSPGHFTEWVEAIKTKDPKKALSNFEYAGRLTETVLLGVVALKAGTKIEWDAKDMRAKNNSDADQYIRRDYRKGFSIHV